MQKNFDVVKIYNDIASCELCAMSQFRKNTVPGRGSLRAQVLFIGEAPGRSEDLLGEAFVGPSGVVLDSLMRDAAKMCEIAVPSFYIVNTVMCRPTDERQGDNRAPTPLEVCNCTPHVMRIARLIKPQIVVYVGKIAEKYYKREFGLSFSIQHPSYILRSGGRESAQYLHNARLLAEAYKELI